MKKLILGITGAGAAAAAYLWKKTAPPEHIRITGKYVMGEVPPEIAGVMDSSEPLKNRLKTDCLNMPGADEVIYQERTNTAFVDCMDGWIWKVDLATMKAERYVDVPLMASGAQMDPNDDNIIYFCGSVLRGETYPAGEKVGIYKLNIETKEIIKVIDRVPNIDYLPINSPGAVYANNEKSMKVSDMTESNSSQTAFCNDLALSRDGKRVYWSEPFAYEGASMGGGAVPEAVSLGDHGRLWRYDMETHTVSLICQGFCFVDGLLLEYEGDSKVECSALITETIKYTVIRLHLTGSKIGTSEVLWKDLPGMPDGLGRDEYGNIWIGLLHARSSLMNFIYAHPWIKYPLLRLPAEFLESNAPGAGLLAFNEDCSKPLYCTTYAGENISDISAVIGFGGKLYMPQFVRTSKGLNSIDNPLKK